MDILRDLKVLVVENDELNATLLQLQLASHGASVVGIAASVRAAMGLLEGNDPQVVFLDFRLAGIETSTPIAEALLARGIPFVVATGMDPDCLPDVFRSGILLRKPYLTAELVGALNKALSTVPAGN
jgi:CheY-like chemotaxis protein